MGADDSVNFTANLWLLTRLRLQSVNPRLADYTSNASFESAY
jgi:hypothetical protein